MATEATKELVQEFKETYPRLIKRGTKFEPLGSFQIKASIPVEGGMMWAIFDGFKHRVISIDSNIETKTAGRPKKYVKKDSQIRIRMTPDVKKKLEKIAKVTGKTMSDFICSQIEESFQNLENR